MLMIYPVSGFGATRHEVYFKNSDHELDIYHIHGRQDGPTLMIMGGIQGDEPGGYLAADLYVDMSLKRGNLIVIPRANFYSILVNKRGPNGDMNRKFGRVDGQDPDSEVVKKIKGLMATTDYFLNLHDGSGFFRPDYVDNMHNPRRFGQSIIADSASYTTANGEIIDLEGIALRVISQVNASIPDETYRFHWNNHCTAEKDSIHKQQRKSATFYVLTKLNKPAFACETSKSIRDFRKRVVYQTMVINAFMDQIGIVPEQPSIYIEPPKMEYALVSINDSRPVAIRDGDYMSVNRGDRIKVMEVRANYERGIIVDIQGTGQVNDIGRPFRIWEDTRIDIKKDMFPCGKIYLGVAAEICRTWLILDVNGTTYAMNPDSVLDVLPGTTIVLKDLSYHGSRAHGFNINFKGFVPDKKNNSGEDRGYSINTGDLLEKYGKKTKDDKTRYRVCAMQGDAPMATFFIDIKAP